ncbi:MAG TPA: right-handed parallel beta-helix repeat-containing protein [Ktedonobacterales bacterium]|nr:right-handed parallel beta-helix repeat-containing protein [Ktedonobacterales bacterium]
MSTRKIDASRQSAGSLVRFACQHARLLIVVLVIVVCLGAVGTVGIILSSAHQPVAGGQGATLPYSEIEAENAATNGTIIGPDYTFTHLASEASGRKAVTLHQGQYVEFTLPRAANSIDVRYSIPDAADGSGLTASLSVYINGVHHPNQTLTLTSIYDWFYGGYPFTNNPKQGFAHHFYDEAHLLLGEMPVGTKVRLQVDPGDTAPSYTIDLADFEEVAPLRPMPAGYISVTDPPYNADPTGKKDTTRAIQQAIDAGGKAHKGVWLPPGNFLVTDHLLVDQVTLAGAGPWYSVLTGAGVGVYGQATPHPSQNVHLTDFAIFGQVMNRDDTADLSGIGGALGGGSVVSDIWIEHTKVGIWLDGPFDGLVITHCRIRDLTADGINFHDGVTHATVEQTEVRNTGDDGLAMWSEHNADANDAFLSNTVQLPILANDIAIYGGTNNRVSNNLVADSVTQGGGIHVANRFNAVPLSGTTTITNNTLIRAGCFDPNFAFGDGALWFYAVDEAMSGKVVVSQNVIDDSVNEAIQFLGVGVTNISLDHIAINGAGTFAVQEQSPGSASFSYVTASGLGASSGIYNCGDAFTIAQGSGNMGWNTTSCGFPAERGG